MQQTVKDWTGKIIGSLEDKGDRIVAKDFGGRILGHYDKGMNKTFSFEGFILMEGDGTMGLIMGAANK